MNTQTQKPIEEAVAVSDAMLATAADMSGASIYQTFAHSAILMYENAVAEQQRGAVAANAAVDATLRDLLALGARSRLIAANAAAPESEAARSDAWMALMQAIER
jgi:Killing trait